MSGLLEGRVAIVTGAGQGVGEGIAAALAAAGAGVVIAARRPDNGEPAAKAIRDQGGQALFCRCDGDPTSRCGRGCRCRTQTMGSP